MSNQIEGVIQKLWKGQVKEHPSYGPSAPFVITINNQGYRTFVNLKKGDPFKEGDNVKFQWEEKFNEYTGNMEKNIVKSTLENLTNPEATTKKSAGAGWKAQDPETGIRIANQSCLGYAIEILKHNLPGTKIIKSELLTLAAELVEYVYTHKPSTILKAPVNPIKNDNNSPVESYPPIDHKDDD